MQSPGQELLRRKPLLCRHATEFGDHRRDGAAEIQDRKAPRRVPATADDPSAFTGQCGASYRDVTPRMTIPRGIRKAVNATDQGSVVHVQTKTPSAKASMSPST